MAGYCYLEEGDLLCMCGEPMLKQADVVLQWCKKLYFASEYRCANCGHLTYTIDSKEFTGKSWAQEEVTEAKAEGVFRDLDKEDQQ